MQMQEPYTWLALVIGAVSLFLYFSRRSRRTIVTQRVPVERRAEKDTLVTIMTSDRIKGMKVCLCDSVIWNKDGTMAGASKEFLRKFCSLAEVYVFCRMPTPEQQERALADLRAAMASSFIRHRVLFCSTTKAYEAFARQLLPTVFFTDDISLAKFLGKFLPFVAVVAADASSSASETLEGNVTLMHSLATLLPV